MNMLKMIGKIKEVLTWVWIAVIGTAIVEWQQPQTCRRKAGKTTEFLYG